MRRGAIATKESVRQSASEDTVNLRQRLRQSAICVLKVLCRLMDPGSAEAVLSIRGRVGEPGRGEGIRRGLVPRLVQSGSRVVLPPPIPTRTPSAAPPCVVPLSIPPMVVSVVALWLWLPLVAFVPLLREWLLCSLAVHLQPFVNVVGWVAPFANEARSAEVRGVPLPF